MLGLLGITKNSRQAFTLPDPLAVDAPRRVDKHGKVLHNPDWTAKIQVPINIEFHAIATELIMQNKKVSHNLLHRRKMNAKRLTSYPQRPSRTLRTTCKAILNILKKFMLSVPSW